MVSEWARSHIHSLHEAGCTTFDIYFPRNDGDDKEEEEVRKQRFGRSIDMPCAIKWLNPSFKDSGTEKR